MSSILVQRMWRNWVSSRACSSMQGRRRGCSVSHLFRSTSTLPSYKTSSIRTHSLLQRAWRKWVASRASPSRAPTSHGHAVAARRTAGVAAPRTPDPHGTPRNTRSARLKGWLRAPSSTNTGFGRSVTDRGEGGHCCVALLSSIETLNALSPA